jgi:hypothetical protein
MSHDIANALVPFFLDSIRIYCRKSEPREIAGRSLQYRARGLCTFICFLPPSGKHEARKLRQSLVADPYPYNYHFVAILRLRPSRALEQRLRSQKTFSGRPRRSPRDAEFCGSMLPLLHAVYGEHEAGSVARTPSLPEQNANVGDFHACCPLGPS